jgi:tellurite resistance protein TerC
LYLGFTALVVVLLTVDLALQRKITGVSVRDTAVWTVTWILLALMFGVALYTFADAHFGPVAARRVGLEYTAGYLLEKSLSIDNMFVFALLFRHFGIPARYQRRVLFCGVIGAILLRGLFIAVGALLIHLERGTHRVRHFPDLQRHPVS